MDGRWKRLIAGGILCASIGCSHTGSKKSSGPTSTGEPPLGMLSNDADDQRARKDGPIMIETLLAVASVRSQAAADPNRSSAEREDLYNQARQIYQQALQRDPKSLEATLGMARLHRVMEDREKCVEWYQRAAKMQPNNAAVWNEMGVALGGTFKDRDGAINAFHAATKIDPENRVYRKALGFSLALVGRYDEAYAWLSKVYSSEAEARYNLAGIMNHNGNHDQAKQQFAMALQTNPNHDASKQALAWYTGPREKPMENAIQTVSHEQVTPLPIATAPIAPTPRPNVEPMAMPPRALPPLPGAGEPLPLNMSRPNGLR